MAFRRIEVYTEAPLTTEMTNIIIHIMVEVLSILGIATKEVKKGRISKFSTYKCVTVGLSICRKICKETDRKDRYQGCAEEAR